MLHINYPETLLLNSLSYNEYTIYTVKCVYNTYYSKLSI